MRLAVLGLAVLSLGMTGCTGLPFLNAEAQTQALAQDHYIRDVQVAVNTLTFVFEQADVSLKAVTSGWLASEGAATQFAFLHGRVKEVKDTLSATDPPAAYETFHRQLGRSLSLTQQAMDSMEAGFTSGDGTYFTLAQEKLGEARTTLGRAVHEL